MTITSASLVGALSADVTGEIDLPADLWGFGGVHGGLAIAMMLRANERHAHGGTPRYVTAQLHRAVRGPFRVAATVVGRGRSVHAARAVATVEGRVHISAAVVHSIRARHSVELAPSIPSVPPPERCEVITFPIEMVPFSQFVEIRPADDARPFQGGSVPRLTAWARLCEDDRPPDDPRLVVLLDALAPSYTAVLEAPVVVPTLEYSVRFGAAAHRAASPWVLLRASTRAAGDGWIDEQIDAWSPDGHHLASATQVRLVREVH